MNKATLSDEFSKQIEVMTAGTPYASNCFDSELERHIRELMYFLWLDAQANKLARHLETKMEAHFEELYEFSYGVTFYDNAEHPTPKRTEALALMIIDEKEGYKKRIKRLGVQHKRFKGICDLLFPYDRELFISYFERAEKVDYERLREAIKHNLAIIEPFYGFTTQARTRRLQGVGKSKKEKKVYMPGIGYVSKAEWELQAEMEWRKDMIAMFGEDYPFE